MSRARADGTYAHKLAGHLRAHGLEVWTDAAVVHGAEWQEAIQEKIDSCAAFVAVMSPAARTSAWVRREVQHAQTQRKQIFPLPPSGAPLFAVDDLRYEDVGGAGMPSPHRIDHLRVTASRPEAGWRANGTVHDPDRLRMAGSGRRDPF